MFSGQLSSLSYRPGRATGNYNFGAPPWSLNNARIQIEACCQIFDCLNEKKSTYMLGASCKTEQVGEERDMWHMPNADFCPILSDEEASLDC